MCTRDPPALTELGCVVDYIQPNMHTWCTPGHTSPASESVPLVHSGPFPSEDVGDYILSEVHSEGTLRHTLKVNSTTEYTS